MSAFGTWSYVEFYTVWPILVFFSEYKLCRYKALCTSAGLDYPLLPAVLGLPQMKEGSCCQSAA